MRSTPSPLRLWPALAVALFVLNASLTFVNVWPTPKIDWGRSISVELAACVLLLAVAYRWAGPLSRRVLPVVWVLLVAGRYVDVTTQGLFGRELNVYWDSAHFGNVAEMLLGSTPAWLVVAVAAGALACVWLVFAAARMALSQVAHAVQRPLPRWLMGLTAAALMAVFTVQVVFERPSRWVPFPYPATFAYSRQARFLLATIGPDRLTPALGESPDFDRPLDGLRGADVLLVFMESYGAVTYETPAIADPLREARADLAAAVRETGREALTAYVDSPTFGGSSWLAHLSLISGVEVRDQYAYTTVMASTRDTLVANFARRGYRTVALMPGMRQAWPEGAFYRYDRIYGRDALEYDGPEFGWWAVPDQWALARIDALERARTGRRPLFIVFPTSTTHAPFGPVPPYQPDWSKVLTAEAFPPDAVAHAMAERPDLNDLRPSYVRATRYEYTALAGYLRQHAADDMVIVALGDHQPPAAVSGPGASWSVPVHVFGRPGPVIDRLLQHGFQPGLEPQHPPLGRMHTLTPVLLDAFGVPLHGT